MPFFPARISGEKFEIKDLHHIKNVLRIRQGERICVYSEGKIFEGIVESVNRYVSGRILSEYKINKLKSTLYAAVVKYKNMRRLIENASQAGFGKVVAVISERSPRYNYEKLSRAIAEAGKQSGNFILLEIKDFMEAVKVDAENKVVFDLSAERYIERKDISDNTHFLIGPEGGFSRKEISTAVGSGWKLFKIRCPVVRTENMPLVICGMFI